MAEAEIISITTRRNALRLGGAASALVTLFKPEGAAVAALPSPDAALIGVCTRLHAINREIADLFNHDYDPDTIDELAEPLNEAWHGLTPGLFALKPPSTPEGARAAALALLANLSSEEFEMAVQDADPVLWLSIGLAKYLIGPEAT